MTLVGSLDVVLITMVSGCALAAVLVVNTS